MAANKLNMYLLNLNSTQLKNSLKISFLLVALNKENHDMIFLNKLTTKSFFPLSKKLNINSLNQKFLVIKDLRLI